MFSLKRSLPTVSLALSALALTACINTGGTVLQPAYISGAYQLDMLNYAASRGGMLTEVVGNPFQAPKHEIDQTVTASMAKSHFGPDLPFVTSVPAENTSPYRVVMLFNPAPNARADSICENSAQPTAAQPGEVSVMAAFCSSDDRVTSTVGSVSGVTSPKDPAFQNLVRQVTIALFPPKNPDRRNDRDWEL